MKQIEMTLIEGRIVHFVLDEGVQIGRHRAAIVVNVYGDDAKRCDLIVFTDDRRDKLPPFVRKDTIRYSPSPEPGTWHWIEE